MSNDEQKVQDQKTEEQIPLKTQEEGAEPEAPTEVAPEEPKPKKNWFTWGKKKGSAQTTDDVEAGEVTENTEGQDGKEKVKKAPWWKKSCQKTESQQEEENISIGIDLVHRDEKNLNSHIQLAFDDIFGEADSQHSWDCVWRVNYRIFTWTRLFVYRLLGLLAIPFTILFAILFGLFAVLNVYIIVPTAKLLSIPANALAAVWNWFIHAAIDPISTSLGLFFSKFTIRKYGINQETTAPCV